VVDAQLAPQVGGDRQADPDQHPALDPGGERERGGERAGGDQGGGRGVAPQPRDRAELDQRDHSRHHDRGQDRGGQVGEQ